MGGGPSHPARSAGRCREGPVCSAPAGARRRRGARARLCARGAAERLPLRQPSPALREVPQSQWLPGRPRTALPAGARRRHPHLRPPSLLLLLRCRARLSPSLRTRAPAAPDLASERPGVARVPRSARRRRGRRPQSAPCARGRPAAERAPSRMPAPWWQAPDAAGRAARPQVSARGRRGLGTARRGRSAPSRCAFGGWTQLRAESGREGTRVEFLWRPQVTAVWPWDVAPPRRTGARTTLWALGPPQVRRELVSRG